jgi:hypothetical protein
MATKKIAADSYFLFVDPAGGTSYSDVVCLTDFNFSGSTAVNDAGTMCGPDQSAGDITSTIALNAAYMLDPDTGEISAPNIFTLWQDKTTFGWKIGPADTAATGDVTKTGIGFFSAYGENYAKGTPAAFSATIAVKGEVTQVIAP